MKPEKLGWFYLILKKILIIAVIAMGKFTDWVKRKLQRDETRDSSVDPAPLGVTDILCKPLRVNVEIINGECYVENGDKHLNTICKETIAAMTDFQRQMLMIAPEGKPKKLTFVQEITRDGDSVMSRRVYFQSDEERETPAAVKALQENHGSEF
ncbi:hypothetical protein RRG08_033623 [Elysia crispata]|uniref:Uncharacterized protein n=1 Tax=Elysia crispata TaxID=231223 RepID=A0AAE0XRA1_9GAST|nr:hypothetical protein RRG08_033623 [Elysia crispata]